MKRNLLLLLAILIFGAGYAQTKVMLPEPDKTGGMPLMEALSKRSTDRNFTGKALTQQQLSDLLWGAWGINRADGRRTAPSAVNEQDIDLYVFLPDGAYRYDAGEHALVVVAKGDFRDGVCTQAFGKTAPVHVVFVSDLTRLRGNDEQQKRITAAADSGFIGQNIYLVAASEGMKSVVYHGGIDRTKVAELLGLPATSWPVCGQAVGF